MLNEKNTNLSIVETKSFSVTSNDGGYFNIAFVFGCLVFLFLLSKYYFKFPTKIINLILLGFIILFIFEFIPVKYILSDTTTTGGDTFFHYIAAKFMKEQLLPHLKISGWYQGSYAGFPLFTYYSPLSFIVVSLLSLVIKFNIAFKIVTLAGIFGLPIAMYSLAKNLNFPKNGGLIAAVLSLIFIFNESYSMYGGNILSTLAGEFTYVLALCLLLIFTGQLYKGINCNMYVKLNAILLFFIGFTHPLPFIIAVLQQVFFILPKFYSKKRIKQNFWYLVKVNFLAFLLIAFWILPSVIRINYTTALDEFWPLKIKEIFPNNYTSLLLITIPTFFFIYIRKYKHVLFIFFNIYLSTVMLFFSDKLGLVNVRFIPFISIYIIIVAAFGISHLLQLLKTGDFLNVTILFSVVALVFYMVTLTTHSVSSWAKWNYTGIENKPFGNLFFEMMAYIKNLPGEDRIVYEHSTMQNNLGTTRTFESLYEFTGKPTLEGLYIQASSTSPFIYYMQSEVSEIGTNVIVGNEYTTFDVDFEKTVKHLKQFNVRYYLAVSDEVKDRLDNCDEFQKIKEFFPYTIYELKTNKNSYIEILSDEVKVSGDVDWKDFSYNKFIEGDDNIYINTNDDFINSTNDCLQKNIELVDFSNERISFKTDAVGCPHLVKVSHYPKWQVKGYSKIYQATPNFMVVYPDSEFVEIEYKNKAIDTFSELLSLFAWIYIIVPVRYSFLFIKKLLKVVNK